MEVTAEVVIGIIAVLVCLPPTILVLIGWIRNHLSRRRNRAIVPADRDIEAFAAGRARSPHRSTTIIFQDGSSSWRQVVYHPS
ncbi:hypothetical protein MCOR25_002953 [Pyricularia grisea]|uniref:Uncharacterized protein n=1 Tax=Pyricularia grisea TaxID=148305 RepID=A0A6P8AU53_PYRGI|nr:uncharacterized protein PgNI_08760 [Pyricularia grisea]KAI6375385.1 hypothetical protein MCOR25_002953 [Pyricularia grisea]TLD05699.1 hypothetical protein PgNI_08760 [Pyricularia grisea]